MLALFFSLGDELYAIPARSVVEVVPKVALRALPRSPSWFAGVLAYRGTVIQVVDLCARLLDVACASRLSSRIVVVERSVGGSQSRYGILTERVTEVRKLSASAGAAIRVDDAPYVSSTMLEEGKLVQLLDLDAVLPSAYAGRPVEG